MPAENSYLESKVMTANAHQLHLMVVDGAIRFANHALESLEQGDFEAMYLSLNRSREFVGELIAGLDESQMPETIKQLRNLFLFVIRNLAEADPSRDGKRIESALRVLRLHRETWVTLGERLQPESGVGATSQRSWST